MCPIYGPDSGRDRPKLIGSGVLLDFAKARFLITAAHVYDWFEENESKMYVPGIGEGGKGLVEMHGQFIKASLPASGKRDDDKYDWACIRLDNELADQIAVVRYFLPFPLIDVDDRSKPGDRYLFAGYPCNREKQDFGKGLVQPAPWSFLGSAVDHRRTIARGFQPEHHIAVRFQREGVTDEDGKNGVFPKATGMSGGPVWRGAGPHRDWLKTTQVKLVGIGIEAREKDKLMIGVRIHVITDSIAVQYADIAALVPRRKRP